MTQIWFVIDSDGRATRPDGVEMDFWQSFNYATDDSGWPDFTQLVVQATAGNVSKALATVAVTEGLTCHDITDHPADWEGALTVAKNGSSLCLSEVDTELEERLIHPEFVDKLVGMLACDALLFGHDSSVGLIHVTRYGTGAPEVMWCDSTMPGPSFARTFHRNGQATDEDPRTYALRELNMPETSPLLDRFAFVHRMLKPFELEGLHPMLDELPVVRVFRLKP